MTNTLPGERKRSVRGTNGDCVQLQSSYPVQANDHAEGVLRSPRAAASCSTADALLNSQHALAVVHMMHHHMRGQHSLGGDCVF